MIPRRLRRASRGVFLGSFLSTETAQIPFVNLLRDHEERGNRRLEEAINRMIDVQREMKAELKQGHTELRAALKQGHTELRAELNTQIERNAQLLRTEIKADTEANAQLLRFGIQADIERIKADAEANAYKLRLDLEQKINSSFWNLLFGLPSVMGVVIAAFGYFGGTINISLNPESSGGRK